MRQPDVRALLVTRGLATGLVFGAAAFAIAWADGATPVWAAVIGSAVAAAVTWFTNRN